MSGQQDSERVLIDPRHLTIPEVALVGHYCYRSAQPALSPHIHNALEICLLVRGEQVFNVAGKDYPLRRGDVFFTRPDEPHSTAHAPTSPAALYWAQFIPPRPGHTYLGLPYRKAALLFRQLKDLPVPHFHGAESLERIFEKMFTLLPREDYFLRKETLRTLLLSLLLEFFELARQPRAQHLALGIQRVLARLDSHTGDPLTVPEMARIAHLSESHFKSAFRRQIGMPPAEYALRQRVGRARELLMMTNTPITRLAQDLGFATSQHFATVFLKFVGVTPRRYRQHGPPRPDSEKIRRGAGIRFHPADA